MCHLYYASHHFQTLAHSSSICIKHEGMGVDITNITDVRWWGYILCLCHVVQHSTRPHYLTHLCRCVRQAPSCGIEAPPPALQHPDGPLYHSPCLAVARIVVVFLCALWVVEGGEQPPFQRLSTVTYKVREWVRFCRRLQ